MNATEQSLRAADEIIGHLKRLGKGDYFLHRQQIAKELYMEGIWDGNWDSTTDLNDPFLPDLRLIQEDEYDQHMDEDPDRPDPADMIRDVTGGYLFIAD